MKKIIALLMASMLFISCSDKNRDDAEVDLNPPLDNNGEINANSGNDDTKARLNTYSGKKANKEKIVRTYTKPDPAQIAQTKSKREKTVPVQIEIWVDQSVLITDEGEEISLLRGESLTAYSRNQDVLNVRTGSGVFGKLAFCDTNYGFLVASENAMTRAIPLPEKNAVKRKYFRCWNEIRKDNSKGIVIQGPISLKKEPNGNELETVFESWQIVRVVERKIINNELWYKINAGKGVYGWISSHHVFAVDGPWHFLPVARGDLLLESKIVSKADKFEMTDLWVVSNDLKRAIPRIIGYTDKVEFALTENYKVTKPMDGMNWIVSSEMFLFNEKQVLDQLAGNWKPVIYKQLKRDMNTDLLPSCDQLSVNLEINLNREFIFSFGADTSKLKFDSLKINKDGTADLLKNDKISGKLVWIAKDKNELELVWNDTGSNGEGYSKFTSLTRLSDAETIRAEKRIKVLLKCDKK